MSPKNLDKAAKQLRSEVAKRNCHSGLRSGVCYKLIRDSESNFSPIRIYRLNVLTTFISYTTLDCRSGWELFSFYPSPYHAWLFAFNRSTECSAGSTPPCASFALSEQSALPVVERGRLCNYYVTNLST